MEAPLSDAHRLCLASCLLQLAIAEACGPSSVGIRASVFLCLMLCLRGAAPGASGSVDVDSALRPSFRPCVVAYGGTLPHRAASLLPQVEHLKLGLPRSYMDCRAGEASKGSNTLRYKSGQATRKEDCSSSTILFQRAWSSSDAWQHHVSNWLFLFFRVKTARDPAWDGLIRVEQAEQKHRQPRQLTLHHC